jgi:hypothetical protein
LVPKPNPTQPQPGLQKFANLTRAATTVTRLTRLATYIYIYIFHPPNTTTFSQMWILIKAPLTSERATQRFLIILLKGRKM